MIEWIGVGLTKIEIRLEHKMVAHNKFVFS